MPGRREASNFWTTQKVMTEQRALEGFESDFGSEKLDLVNQLREDVKRWRESEYENATQTTKKLLRRCMGRGMPRWTQAGLRIGLG